MHPFHRPKRPILRSMLSQNPLAYYAAAPQRRVMPSGSTQVADPTWAHLPWIYIAHVGFNQNLATVENQANLAGIDRYVILDPLVFVPPNQPAPAATGWLYVVDSDAPPKHVRQVMGQAVQGLAAAPFFSKGKFVDIAVVGGGFGFSG